MQLPEFNLSLFLLGVLGGLLTDLLRIYKQMRTTPISDQLKEKTVWQSMILLGLFGGLVVYLAGPSGWEEAIIIGYGAPQFLSKLVAGTEEPQQTQAVDYRSIRAMVASAPPASEQSARRRLTGARYVDAEQEVPEVDLEAILKSSEVLTPTQVKEMPASLRGWWGK